MSQSEYCTNVGEWLGILRLEQYSDVFQSAGLATLEQCRSLTPDKLEWMGITLPGHQRRILASLNKTHGNRDAHTLGQCERSEETGCPQVLGRERPVPVPPGEKSLLQDNLKQDGETLRPTPRKREKPVPRERQAPRMQENSGEGERPVPGKRQTVPRNGEEKERNGGLDEEREKPVPKERTKFHFNTPVDLYSSSPSSSDTSLPPVPPRCTPNCPPQRFTLPSVQTTGSPKLERREVRVPALQCQSVSPCSSPIPTQAPSQPPNLPSTLNRPQTLAFQLPAQQLSSDERRRSSPVSPMDSPINDRNIPPLPPKAGTASKGPPPIHQRFPAQSPRTHR